MANPKLPDNIKTAAEEADRLARHLKEAAGQVVDLDQSFDIAKDSLTAITKIVKKGTKDSNSIAEQWLKSINKAKNLEEKISIQKAFHAKIEKELSKYTTSTQTARRDALSRMHEVSKELQNQILSTKFQQLGLGKVWQVYDGYQKSILKGSRILKSWGGTMTSSFAKTSGWIGTMGRGMGKLVTGAGAKLAGLGVPVIGWIVTAVMLMKDLAVAVFNVFKEADAAAAKFRMTMGLTRDHTGQIDKDARSIAINLKEVGATFDMAYGSVAAVAQVMGSTVSHSKDLAETVTLFSAQLGISADKSLQVLKTFSQIDRSTMRSQRNMLGFLAKLSAAGKTNLGEVMGDISEFSQSHYRFMRGSALEMAKAAVEARRMGTSLSSAGKSASALLNFTQNINDEMEASVLIGRSIDLQRARSLAYAGKIEDLNKEILRLSKEYDFENMDPFQMQSFAKALGKTEEEIGKILQVERERVAVQRSLDKSPELKRQAQEYQKILDANKANAKSLGEQYVMDLKRKANQERLVAIQNQWNALIQELAEEWLPVIDDALKGVIPVIKVTASIVKFMLNGFISLAKIISGIIEMVKSVFGTGDFQSGLSKWKEGILGYALGPIGSRAILGRPEEKAAVTSETERKAPPGFAATTFTPIPNEVGARAAYETSQVVSAINGLRDDMRSGAIGANVRLDSQEIAAATDRATRFRKGGGTNNASVV